MGDFSCALINSTRDTETYPVNQYAKKNFYVYNIDDKGTLQLYYMVDSTSTYKWVNRTDRNISFDEYIKPIQICESPNVVHWIKDKHKTQKFMF